MSDEIIPMHSLNDYGLTEEQEVVFYTGAKALQKAMTDEQFGEFLLAYSLSVEHQVRSKFGRETPAVKVLDEYYEQVITGVRKPISDEVIQDPMSIVTTKSG